MENKDVVVAEINSLEAYAAGLTGKLQFCDLLIKSNLVPKHFGTKEAVLTAILYGQELGFSPIRALNMITVIQGKPSIEAQGLKALAIDKGAKIETVEWTDKKCTLKCTRGTWTETLTYTYEDAALAGYVGKDNWKRMPKNMLYARCVSMLLRNMFADVIGGLNSKEELEDAEWVSRHPAGGGGDSGEPTGKIIEAESTPSVFAYDLNDYMAGLEGDELNKGLAFLKKNKVTQDQNTALWVAPHRVPALDKYSVEIKETQNVTA